MAARSLLLTASYVTSAEPIPSTRGSGMYGAGRSEVPDMQGDWCHDPCVHGCRLPGGTRHTPFTTKDEGCTVLLKDNGLQYAARPL